MSTSNGIPANSTVSDHISLLRSAFQVVDFDKVEQDLINREKDMKREISKWKLAYESMEKKHGEMALTQLKMEDELGKLKTECGVLRERLKKADTENANLRSENLDLESAKKEADRELEVCKKRFEDLSMRVVRLEEDTGRLINGFVVESENEEKKKERENEVEVEETMVCVEMEGEKEINSDAKDESEAGDAGAGPHSVLMACNKAKPIQNQLLFQNGSSDKVINTSVAADGRAGYGNIIEINDSDDEMPTKDGSTSMLNVVHSGVILSKEETKGAHSGQNGDQRGRTCAENHLLASSSKRKRGSCIDVCESSKNGDDMRSISTRETKAPRELTIDGSDSSSTGDSSCSEDSIDIDSYIASLHTRKFNSNGSSKLT